MTIFRNPSLCVYSEFCFSVHRLLADLFPAYTEVLDRVQLNLKKWKRVKDEFHSRGIPITDSLDFLTDEFHRDLFEGMDDV